MRSETAFALGGTFAPFGPDLGNLYRENGQTLQLSFSAVSKPMQPNVRWKALAEIYSIHSVLQL